MKSILVDALRQANGDDTDQALSDSGSFDTSQEPLDPPANETIEDDHGELELMSTTNALVVQEETQHDVDEFVEANETDAELETEADFEDVATGPVSFEPVDDEHAMTVAGMMPLPVTRRQAPRLALLAPLLCVVLGFGVAASWLLINKLGISSIGLGTSVAQASRLSPEDGSGSDPVPESRFRFLDEGAPGPEEGSTQ